MTTKNKRSGRSFLGTLFLLACGFAGGFYHKEIVAFCMQHINK